MKTCHQSYTKLLREIQHENVSLATIEEFRANNPLIPWTEIIYSKTGDSILHISSRLGQETIVNHIINNWPPLNIDIKNNDSKTPLHEAAQFSKSRIVAILLAAGAFVDSIKRADWTPLMLACTKSGLEALETVTVLLNHNPSLRLVNKDGWTPLHLACRTGDVKIVELLLKHDKTLTKMTTFNGRTLLHIASLHANKKIVELLLKNCDIDINSKDNCGSTPLLDATCSNSIEIVKLLIDNGADINCTNKTGFTSLHLAASENLLEMIQYLVVDLKIDINCCTVTKVTALHCAARKKQMSAIELLIKLGANRNLKDSHGRLAQDYLTL